MMIGAYFFAHNLDEVRRSRDEIRRSGDKVLVTRKVLKLVLELLKICSCETNSWNIKNAHSCKFKCKLAILGILAILKLPER